MSYSGAEMDKYVRQLRTSPEPARVFVISALFQCIDEYIRGESRSTGGSKNSFIKEAIEDCISVVAEDAACLTAVVGHVVGLVERSRMTGQDGYGVLMAGLATENVIIHVVANGIMDIYEMCPEESQRSLVHAWVLKPESAVTFVSRIEEYFVNPNINGEDKSEFWERVSLFLSALVMRPGVSKGNNAALVSPVLDIGSRVRSMLVRLGCHQKIEARKVVEFLIKSMMSYDVRDCKRVEELEACALDIVDVLVSQEEGDLLVPRFLQALFIVSMACLEAGIRVKVFLDAMSHFLPEFGWCCCDMMVPLAIRGMELGEGDDGEGCFDVLCMILNSPDALSGCDGALLSMVECACVRAMFYAQRPRLKRAIHFCTSRVNELLNDGARMGWNDTAGEEGVFCWIQKISSSVALSGTRNEAVHRIDFVYTKVLGLLRHPSLSVRRRVLQEVFSRLAEDPRFSFYALPVVLRRVEHFENEMHGTVKAQGLYMKDLLYSLGSLSKSPSAVPFIVRALTPFASPNAPSGLSGIACSILRRMWLESRKGYSSLKLMILSCDMEDDVETRSNVACRWVRDDPPQEKVAVAAALVSICRDDPAKAKDVVHAIHACVCSKYTCLASSGLACIRMLCESNVLDFLKSWNVVRRILPDLPDDDIVAASWVGLIASVLEEDTDTYEQIMGNTIDLLWEASVHSSELVRLQAYRALEKVDWDVSETLQTLRPPIEYARLLEREKDDSKSLRDCGKMMERILEREYVDRRKQFIQLSSTESNMSRQSHSSRFYKLSNSIPNHLLKESTGRQNTFMKSGSEAEMFVMLYLWRPSGRNNINGPEMYRRVADEMLDKDLSMGLDILMDFENISLLSEGWEQMYHRWIATYVTEEFIEMSEYHGYSREISLIWKEITKDDRLSDKVLNPIIIVAVSSFVRVFGRVESKYVMKSYSWLGHMLKDVGQFGSLQTVCTIALGRIIAHVERNLGFSEAKAAMDILLADNKTLRAANDFALRFCKASDMEQQAFNHLLTKVKNVLPSLGGAASSYKASDINNHTLESFGCLLRQSNMVTNTNLHSILSDIEDIFACGSKDDLIPGVCDLYCSTAIILFEGSQLNDSRITACLDALLSLSDRESLAPYIGHVALAISKLLIQSLKHGYVSNDRWNMDVVIEFMKDLLSKVEKYPCIQSNASRICRGLCQCLEYQMYNQKNFNESFVQENRAEAVIDTICHMAPSSAVRMGCISHISHICRMAMEFRTKFEAESLESMSGSAVGYLSEALISSRWPAGEKDGQVLGKQTVITLLSCLCEAPRLPQKDWSACLRRYIKMFPSDVDIQTRVVKFVCSHATGSIADKLRDFVCIDILNLNEDALKPKQLRLEALCYVFCHLNALISLLSEDQVVLCLNSISHALLIDEKRTKLTAFSLAFGLGKLASEDVFYPQVMYEIMAQVLLSQVDMSEPFLAPLHALYSLSDEELSSFVLKHEKWIYEDEAVSETSVTSVERNARIAACLLQAFRAVDSATQLSITRNENLFRMHPMHFSWICCGLTQPLGIQSMQLLQYNIMSCTPDDSALQTISNMAHAIRAFVRNNKSAKDALTWLEDTIREGTSCVASYLLILCLAACYAGEIGDGSACDLSFDESTLLLPNALRHFMKHYPSHHAVYRHLLRRLIDMDQPHIELLRVSLSNAYLDLSSDQSDWLEILDVC